MRWFWALTLTSLVLAACGGTDETGTGGGPDGPRTIPDGFVQQNCVTNNDCDDGNPCTLDACPVASRVCEHTPKDCTALKDDCNDGVCDATSGDCAARPLADDTVCSAAQSMPGTCQIGVCIAQPQCYTSYSLSCSSYDKTTTSTLSGSSALGTYACATGLDGPERAYPINVPTDRDITLSLTDTAGDFDLLVLEGEFCVSNAKCAASSVTAGTGNETLTFHATGGKDYLIVIESKPGVTGSYTLNITCVGGTCKPIKALACNQSIMGDTTGAKATNIIPSYSCASMETGPEDTYTITQTADTKYNMKLTSLTQDLDLIVMYDSTADCSSTYCSYSGTTVGTADELVSWTGYSGSAYDVIVDSKTAGGPYMLQVDCPPSCSTSTYISCSTNKFTGKNDDAGKSKNLVNSWSCDPNTTGPEVVYKFYPSTNGSYTFTLDGLTADLDLIVIQGDYSTCDPSTTCIASSVTAGTAGESVTFTADSSKYYYIAVDGKNGAVSPYNLKMTSTLCPGASCYNSSNSLGCTYLEDVRKNNDSSKSKNVVDTWVCDPNTTGPEVVYKFVPPANGTYTVDLDGLSADMDLVVVSNTSAYSCDANAACEAVSSKAGTAAEQVTFTADKAKTYYIGVDGKANAVGNYHIKLSSPLCPAPVCNLGSSSLTCSYPSVTARNDNSSATNDVMSWSCAPNASGPEYTYKFTPTVAGTYTLQMIGLHADLDLIVIPADSGGKCQPSASCLAQSLNNGNADEKVTFAAEANKSYYVIVDGKNGATSQFTLAITDGCP